MDAGACDIRFPFDPADSLKTRPSIIEITLRALGDVGKGFPTYPEP
jgi:hypothetical protein